jgi:hypothetical protein
MKNAGVKSPKDTKNQHPAVVSILDGSLRNGRNTISFILRLPFIPLPIDENGSGTPKPAKLAAVSFPKQAKLQIWKTEKMEDLVEVELLPGSGILVSECNNFETIPKDTPCVIFRFPTSPLEVKEPTEQAAEM